MQAKPDLGFHLKSYQDRYFRSILKRAAVESMRPPQARQDYAAGREGGRRWFRVPASGLRFWGDVADSMEALFVAAGLNPIGTKRRDRITLPSLQSWLAIAGLPVRRIQELLGHKSIVTTAAVQHLGDNGMRPSYGELARAPARGSKNPGATPVSGDATAAGC